MVKLQRFMGKAKKVTYSTHLSRVSTSFSFFCQIPIYVDPYILLSYCYILGTAGGKIPRSYYILQLPLISVSKYYFFMYTNLIDCNSITHTGLQSKSYDTNKQIALENG